MSLGIFYLQFERESVGKDVLRWMRQKHSLNFTATKVPVRKGSFPIFYITRPNIL